MKHNSYFEVLKAIRRRQYNFRLKNETYKILMTSVKQILSNQYASCLLSPLILGQNLSPEIGCCIRLASQINLEVYLPLKVF